MRYFTTLSICFLLASPQAHACRPGAEDMVFFESIPNPQPNADLIAEISVTDIKETPGAGEATAIVTIAEVIKTSEERIHKGDKVAMKHKVDSCGLTYKVGDKGMIFAKTGIDGENRIVLYPYLHKPSDVNLIRSPIPWAARTPIEKLPTQSQDEYAKINSGCAAFYSIAKEQSLPTRHANADKLNSHKLYAKRLLGSAQKAEDRYDADLSRQKLAFAKAKAEGTLAKYTYQWESICPSVEFYTSVLIPRWSKGIKEELKSFDFALAKDPRGTVGQAPVCSFSDLKLPSDFAVYAAGAYSGRKIAYQIDQSGDAGTQIDVAVNSPDKPVVLILGAHDPTIWNIGWTKQTNILAVLVSGYDRQVVAGLGKKTPLLISSHHNKGPCGYFYVGQEEKPDAINETARKLFGRPVDMVYPANNGNVVVGEALAGGSKLVTSAEVPPEAYYDISAPLAGMDGLRDALQKGLLRHATLSDSEAWVRAGGAGVPKSRKIFLDNAYVVLKPFTIPAGLYGMTPVVFMIPKGVPRPTGYLGPGTVYDFNTLRCEGQMCGMP